MKIVLALVVVVAAFVVLVSAIAGAFVGQIEQMQQQQAETANTGGFSSMATAALELQDHLTGSHANQYTAGDPFMQRVVGYWKTYCHTASGAVCALAASGTLQCVEFVTAVQWLAGDPLLDHPDAVTFWADYAHEPGWQETPSPSAFPNAAKIPPHLGDLIVWKGGGVLNGTTQEVGGLGHIGVVVGWTAPSTTQNGSIEVAQGNAPGNKYPPLSQNPYIASENAGNTYTMTVNPKYQIATWGPIPMRQHTSRMEQRRYWDFCTILMRQRRRHR